MSDLCKDIVKAFDQLRAFCREVAALLTTADSFMNKREWQAAAGTNVLAEGSGSLTYPDRWIPWYFYRFYEHDEQTHILAFISVIVGALEKREELDQALITAGWLDYGQGNPVPNGWQYWYARWHLWVPDSQDNGQLCSGDSHKEWSNPPEGVRTASTFAYPVTEVTSAADLEQKIVQRLVEGIDKACEDGD